MKEFGRNVYGRSDCSWECSLCLHVFAGGGSISNYLNVWRNKQFYLFWIILEKIPCMLQGRRVLGTGFSMRRHLKNIQVLILNWLSQWLEHITITMINLMIFHNDSDLHVHPLLCRILWSEPRFSLACVWVFLNSLKWKEVKTPLASAILNLTSPPFCTHHAALNSTQNHQLILHSEQLWAL